jgi:hypothetical protein
LVHWGWYLVYLASPKSSQHQANLDTITAIWNNIKIVEYGLESSIQLLLQLWLLHPFLPIILTWDMTEVISRSYAGMVNFLTLEKYPACYIEKALFKILLTISLLSLGISQMKKKPGQTFSKTLPLFMSIFAQTVGRIVALMSLVLMTPLGFYKYALFFVPHILLVCLIKTLFEMTSLRDKFGGCCHSHEVKLEGKIKRIWQLFTFLLKGIASTIVMIHLPKEEHKPHPSFLSHSCFQVLVLLENLLLVSFPFFANGRYYPPKDCFPASSRYYAVSIVILAWLFGTAFQVIHYKYCSPLAGLNGPRARSWCPPSQISFLATLCWKRDVQRIEVYGLCQLRCKDNR